MRSRFMCRVVLGLFSLAAVAGETVPERSIWVMRHGEDGGPERRLTERGRAQVRDAAGRLGTLDGLVILTSPRARCLETARIVHERMPGSRMDVVDWLDYRAPLPDDWRERLPDGPILLVTHQPVVLALWREAGAGPPFAGHAFLQRLPDPR